MADNFISQAEGDELLAMDKILSDEKDIDFPVTGGRLKLKILSSDLRENFFLDYTRYSINIFKINHNFRARKVIGLARLDLGGPPHINPNGKKIGPRHFHVYRENYDLQWAYDLDDEEFLNDSEYLSDKEFKDLKEKFTDLDNAEKSLLDFMKYCKITSLPSFRKGLI